MIVVFVVDTSPSMRQPIQTSGSSSSMLSRLDLAKMGVEDLVRGLNRRVQEHNLFLQQQSPAVQKSMVQLGLGYCSPNQYLLLSTGRQHTDQPATAACGAGGRLLVGYGPDNIYSSSSNAVETNHHGMDHPHFNNSGDGSMPTPTAHANNMASFQQELKQLQASTWDGSKTEKSFPEDAGGAVGLNAALSAGLQLLSRYRLHDRATEHFGMGRLPNPAMMTPTGNYATHALQSACLVLLTDGACLRKSPSDGGGSLQLQYGNMPLREWYKEPFRWDQRVVCLGVGANKESITSTQYLHPHLRALCEVTGGYHTMLRSTTSLAVVTDCLLRILAPPLPRELPLPDPLKSPVTANNTTSIATSAPRGSSTFVNAGPVCCFQALEGDMGTDGQGQGSVYRAMLLYTPFPFPQLPNAPTDGPEPIIFAPPLWCIPENYFPSKKLETLPPRPAQPCLMISRFPSKLGNKTFEPTILMKHLHRLDQLIYSSRQLQQPQQSQPQSLGAVKLLHRDVYICEWVSVDDRPPKYPQPNVYGGNEYFPVMVTDAGRPSNDDAGGSIYFNIGILHVPANTSTLATSTMSASARPFSTLTLLPPEPHILVPLLIKAADAENRALKKAQAGGPGSTNNPEAMAAISRSVQVDEAWKTEFRNYLIRLPPYYQTAMKRGLRPVLPTSLHPLLVQSLANEPTASSTASGAGETSLSSPSIPLQCFSKTCFQKIRNAEQVAKDTNERMERQEAELRGVQKSSLMQQHPQTTTAKGSQGSRGNGGFGDTSFEVDYGQYDPRSGTESFLSALRGLPAPWLVEAAKKRKRDHDEALPPEDSKNGNSKAKTDIKAESAKSADGQSESAVPVISEPNNAEKKARKKRDAMEILGDLPADCLMAYYESRRRWIFGGSGLATRGLMVQGVNNDGSNAQQCSAKPDDFLDQSLLSIAGIGVSTLNETSVTKMGDYRERLLWSRSPVVGYGANDSFGVAATTAADGSPKWSVDDDAMPMTFFDPKTGEFADSVQARLRSRLHVAFGNPFKLRWADSIVPEKYLAQCPSNPQHIAMGDATPPPGSPPHDSYSSNVEEGEAIFNKSPPPKSPPHHSGGLSSPRPPPIRPPIKDIEDEKDSIGKPPKSESGGVATSKDTGSAPPPPLKRPKIDDKVESKPPAPKQPQPFQRAKGDLAKKLSAEPTTPTTPPVGPPKMKSSPSETAFSSGGNSPKPPRPPIKSPRTGTPKGPPSKGQGKKGPPPPGPPPPPPSQKGTSAPPPPGLEKKPSFSLAPSKPLPNLPPKPPSAMNCSQGAPPPPPPPPATTASGSSGSESIGKKLPPPPKLEVPTSTGSTGNKHLSSTTPRPAKIEPATSTGSTGSSGKRPPPAPSGSLSRQAPPPPKPSTSNSSLPSVSKSIKPPPPKPLEYTDEDKKPNVELPSGWMCVWSKSQKRWYFFDTRSNRSVWEWPPPGGA